MFVFTFNAIGNDLCYNVSFIIKGCTLHCFGVMVLFLCMHDFQVLSSDIFHVFICCQRKNSTYCHYLYCSHLLPHGACIVRFITKYFKTCELPELRIKCYSVAKNLLINMGVGM